MKISPPTWWLTPHYGILQKIYLYEYNFSCLFPLAICDGISPMSPAITAGELCHILLTIFGGNTHSARTTSFFTSLLRCAEIFYIIIPSSVG